MDLEQNIDINEVKDMIGDTPLIQTSMLKQEGIDELEINSRFVLWWRSTKSRYDLCF